MQAPIDQLQEGQVLTGEVEELHVLHGAVLDIGFEWHGLVPVDPQRWEEVLPLHDFFALGSKVEVRVHKARLLRFWEARGHALGVRTTAADCIDVWGAALASAGAVQVKVVRDVWCAVSYSLR
jgi:hypothetical protein